MKTLIILIAIIHSAFMGIYATTIYFEESKRWNNPFNKARLNPWEVYQILLNGFGTSAGWIAFYYLLFVKNNYPNVTIADLIISLIALLGISGFIPKVLAGFDLGQFVGKDSRPK